MTRAGEQKHTAAAARAALQDWVRALEALKVTQERPDATLADLIRDRATKEGDRPALIGVEGSLSYRALGALADRYTLWALAQGLGRGDVVALLMPNCADYAAIWLGISQTGCAVALVNWCLVGDGLVHCLSTAGAMHVIVTGALLDAVTAVRARLPPGMRCWVHGETTETELARIDLLIAGYPPGPPAIAPARRPAADDRALLIFTSGTTGLPKAANVSHGRLVEWSCWFAGMMDAGPGDRLYNCLPMYHSIGGVVAIGAMLVCGGSVLIRERFSASRFWDDIADGGCTIFQYIGELCRYLVNAPPHPRETQHGLRLCCGNGLRGEVWEAFQQRFAIPRILEFYAATEGNVSLYNCEGRPGAIGRIPAFLAHRFPVALIRCDAETGEPMRGADGLCIRCGQDEPGEAIGPIAPAGRPAAGQIDIYTDAAASARKLLQDVFAPGDCWFRTGDLMRRDVAGYYYFIDRLGDTFRWKGENVSTTEVAGVIRGCAGVIEAVVYGVAVPGHEGRAGMAAVIADPDFSLETLRAHLAQHLPEYAHPLFVRRCAAIDVTGTFKLSTAALAREGFTDTGDPLWFNDRAGGAFIPCDDALRATIATGQTRL